MKRRKSRYITEDEDPKPVCPEGFMCCADIMVEFSELVYSGKIQGDFDQALEEWLLKQDICNECCPGE